MDVTLKILRNMENIDITLEELRNIENIDKTLKILRKKAWKHWQNITKYWKKTLKILKTLLFCLWVICKQIMFRDIAYHESAIEVIM